MVPNHAWNSSAVNWRLRERGLMLWTSSLLAAAEEQPRKGNGNIGKMMIGEDLTSHRNLLCWNFRDETCRKTSEDSEIVVSTAARIESTAVPLRYPCSAVAVSTRKTPNVSLSRHKCSFS